VHLAAFTLEPAGPKAGTIDVPSAPAGGGAGNQAPPPGGGWITFLPMLMILPVFWLMSRKNKKEAEARSKLKKGDQVVSQAGLVGELVDMDERFAKVKIGPGVTVKMLSSSLSPLDAAPADAEVNRQCARFLANHGEFDQAIACWVRVANVKGLEDEAQREIARLQVEKTIVAGHGMTGRAPAGSGSKAAAQAAQPGQPTDTIAALKQAVQERPTQIEAYLELADLLERDATVEEAEAVLMKALAASGNDLKVREHLEDRQLRWARHRVHIAETRLQEEDTPVNRDVLERLRATQVKHEVEIYSARCARYPENLSWRYELAMRLKAAGNHAEAIKHFQETLNDARRKGAIALELGECFQKIKQYQLAMRNYEVAIESLTDRRFSTERLGAIVARIASDLEAEGRTARLASVKERLGDEGSRKAALGLAIQVTAADGIIRTSERELILEAVRARLGGRKKG
jgi:preprotein translocase subunit YajC